MGRTPFWSVWMEAAGDGANTRREYSVKMRVCSVRRNLADESAPLCFDGGVSLLPVSLPSLYLRPREKEGAGTGQGVGGACGGG